MKLVDPKSQILEEAGYVYSLDRMIYVNRKTRKVFSEEFVDDHSEDELQKCIDEKSSGEWRFYFNGPPSESVQRELVSLLG